MHKAGLQLNCPILQALPWQDPAEINTRPNNASQYLNASNPRQFVNGSHCEAVQPWSDQLVDGSMV